MSVYAPNGTYTLRSPEPGAGAAAFLSFGDGGLVGDGTAVTTIQVDYGKAGSNLVLNLVYNPDGPILPPDQQSLREDYQQALKDEHNIVFNELFALANMPISRFGARLLAKNQYDEYMNLLRGSFSEGNLETVMCRTLLSVDYQGYVYDCDFNQMLMMQTLASNRPKPHLRDLIDQELEGSPIAIGEHCYGCTAGQGSSCGGALV